MHRELSIPEQNQKSYDETIMTSESLSLTLGRSVNVRRAYRQKSLWGSLYNFKQTIKRIEAQMMWISCVLVAVFHGTGYSLRKCFCLESTKVLWTANIKQGSSSWLFQGPCWKMVMLNPRHQKTYLTFPPLLSKKQLKSFCDNLPQNQYWHKHGK